MSERADLLLVFVALAIAAFACRAGGFLVMRYVNVTPRVEAAMRAAPLAVMIGVVAPAALRGSVPELVGLAATAIVMRWRGNDVVAAFAGVIVVALLRYAARA